MSSGEDIFNFLKTKITSIGIPEDQTYLFLINDTIKDYTKIPLSCVIIETSSDDTHFTHYGSRKNTLTGNIEHFTTIVEKAQDVYVCIIANENDIFAYRDNFYKSFEKNDQFTGTANGAYRIVFLRDEFYTLRDKKLGLAEVVIFLKFYFSLQNKKEVKPISNIKIENVNIETSY